MRFKHTNGFTLVELMVTVAVAAIVLTLGVPSFKDTIRDNRMAGNSNRFLSALNIARSEAIKRAQQVAVCKANVEATPPSCNSANCNSGTNCWENGWMVFVDADRNGAMEDSNDLIRVFEALPKGLTLRVAGTHDTNWVAFNSLGQGLGSGAGNRPDDTFRLCQGSDTVNARSIAINLMGRAKIEKGATTCP